MDALHTIYVLAAVLAIATIAFRMLLIGPEREFRSGAKQLLDKIPQQEKYYSQNQLDGLPPPVKRYFAHVLREGQRHVSSVKVLHDGQFRAGMGSGWAGIKGIEYLTAAEPGFIWKGKTNWFTATDSFTAGKGRLVVRLFSIVKILEKRGKKIDEAELMRWIAESIWFPTALLPSAKLRWLPVNDNSAKLEYTNEGQHIAFLVTFSAKDEIEAIETQRCDGKGRRRLWQGKASHYRRHGGMLIPSRLEAVWKLPEGDMPYARFHLQDIRYDLVKP